MPTQHTTYHSGSEVPEDVITESEPGETTRMFSARHLDDLDAAFAAVPLSTAALGPQGGDGRARPPVLPPVTHFRLSNGARLEFPYPIIGSETGQEWGARCLKAIAKVALQHPADL